MTESTRLLDDKVAQTDAFTYNGMTGGAAWKERVADYMIGKCSDCVYLLRWAEDHSEAPIELWNTAQLQDGVQCVNDPNILSAHIWTSLGFCLKDQAKAVYNQMG